jgi:hypothetical protein
LDPPKPLSAQTHPCLRAADAIIFRLRSGCQQSLPKEPAPMAVLQLGESERHSSAAELFVADGLRHLVE